MYVGMGPNRLYFAYGSNLQLEQMKRRCPDSKLIGHGILRGFRWQINERGYANIVAEEGRDVQGLCYEISPTDEARLDVNEGVTQGAYAKKSLPVEIQWTSVCLYRRPTAWIVANGGINQILRAANNPEELAVGPRTVDSDVLVYVSDDFKRDSDPRDEYVSRIKLGLQDARALGMDSAYVQTYIRPFIPLPKDEHDGEEGGVRINAASS